MMQDLPGADDGRMSRRRLLTLLVLGGATSVLTACAQSVAPTVSGQASPVVSQSPAVTSASASASASGSGSGSGGGTLQIGASVSTTGSNGQTGLYQQQAYLLWEEQVNQRGGLLGRPVKLTIYDDQSDPTTASRLYERLITQDKVDLVLGPYASNVSQAVAQVTERYAQPMLAAGASASDIWKRGYKNIFGLGSVAEDFFKRIVSEIATTQGYKTAALIYEDSLFPIATADGATEAARAAGISIVLNEKYPTKVSDVSSLLTRVRDLNPDMLIGGSYLPDSTLIVRQAKELGFSPKMFTFSVGPADPNFGPNLGSDGDWVLAPSFWEPAVNTPGNEAFVSSYRARWNRDPDYHSASGFAACTVLEAAVKQVGSVDRPRLREALVGMRMPTVMPGEYHVDETGLQRGHVLLTIQWQKGKKVIVAPKELADGQVNLPMPHWNQR